MFKFFLIALVVLIGTVSCSPKLNNREFLEPVTDLKPELGLQPNFEKINQNSENFKIEYSGEKLTSDFQELILQINNLGQIEGNKNLLKTSSLLYDKLYSKTIYRTAPVSKSPYIQIFIDEAYPSVKSAVTDTEQKIYLDLEKVNKTLKQLTKDYNWPEKSNFSQTVGLVDDYLTQLEAKISGLKLLKEFETELISQVREEKKFNIQYLTKVRISLEKEVTLANSIKIMEQLISEFNVSVEPEIKEKLKVGKGIAKNIDEINDEMSAFGAIVSVWLLMSDQERKTYFIPISQDLYNFLNDYSAKELTCLVEKSCPSFFEKIFRSWALLPKIEKIGPGKIKTALNENTYQYVVEILEAKLLIVVKHIDERVSRKVIKNVDKATAKIKNIKSKLLEFITDKVKIWSEKTFKMRDGVMSSFEYPFVLTELKDSKLSVKPLEKNKSMLSADLIGKSLELNTLWLADKKNIDPRVSRVLFEVLNRMMSLGGATEKRLPGVDGFINSIDGIDDFYNLATAASSSRSYNLQDTFELGGSFKRKLADTFGYNLTASNQIALARGLLAFTDFMKDWKQNYFDISFSPITSFDIFGPTDQKIPLFKKTDLFGMSVGQVANWVSNLDKNYSQVGLLTDDGQVVWLNELTKVQDKTILFAAYVDIVEKQKQMEVSVENIAQFIRLLEKIPSVVLGLENTKFKALLEKDSSSVECSGKEISICPNLAQKITSKVSDIKKLYLPFGNTLAAKLRGQKGSADAGLVYSKAQLPNFKIVDRKPKLMDQLLAIETLIHIYQSTKIETYLWSAKETFSVLQKYYNPTTNFFEMDSDRIKLPELVQAIRTFHYILPYLDGEEKNITNEKVKTWILALERIN